MVGPRFGRFRRKDEDTLRVDAASAFGSNSHASNGGHASGQAGTEVVLEQVVVDSRGGKSLTKLSQRSNANASVYSQGSVELGSVAEQPSLSFNDNGFPSGMPRFHEDEDEDEVSMDPSRSEQVTESSVVPDVSQQQQQSQQPPEHGGNSLGASSVSVEVGAGSGNGIGSDNPVADELSDEEDYAESIPGHSSSEMIAGCFILWFGWYGFNVGSTQGLSSSVLVKTASRISLTMTLCPAAAAVTSSLYHRFISATNTWCLDRMANAMLCGLVAVTAPCAVIDAWSGVILGIVSCFTYEFASTQVVRLRIDDPVDGFAVHGCGGMLGLIWCGLFAKPSHLEPMGYHGDYPGLFMGGGFGLLGVQLLGGLYLITVACLGALLVFTPLKMSGRLRVSLHDELMGLDIAKHGGSAYPEWHKIT